MYTISNPKYLIYQCPICGHETGRRYRDPSWCHRTLCQVCKTFFRAIYREDNKCVRCSTRGKCMIEGMSNVRVIPEHRYYTTSSASTSDVTITYASSDGLTGTTWFYYDSNT